MNSLQPNSPANFNNSNNNVKQPDLNKADSPPSTPREKVAKYGVQVFPKSASPPPDTQKKIQSSPPKPDAAGSAAMKARGLPRDVKDAQPDKPLPSPVASPSPETSALLPPQIPRKSLESPKQEELPRLSQSEKSEPKEKAVVRQTNTPPPIPARKEQPSQFEKETAKWEKEAALRKKKYDEDLALEEANRKKESGVTPSEFSPKELQTFRRRDMEKMKRGELPKEEGSAIIIINYQSNTEKIKESMHHLAVKLRRFRNLF